MKVSIIVPIYNTSLYLRKCLDSLVNQTLSNIEIILVNDGSTDGSIDIINEYKNKHNNIVVVDKENGGVSSARNEGIKIATSKYIGFVDSDDYIDLTMYETLYNASIMNDFDLVICDLYETDGLRKRKMYSGLNRNLHSKKQIQKNMNSINSTLCNKIYKTNILKNNLFTLDMEYEDVEFLYRLFYKINNIGVINKPLYYYYTRNDSKTHTYNESWYKLLDNLDIIIDKYKNTNNYLLYKNELEYMYVKYSLGTFLKKISKCSNIEEFTKSYNYAINKLNSAFPEYKNNFYLKKVSVRNIYFSNVDRFSIKYIYKFLTKFM